MLLLVHGSEPYLIREKVRQIVDRAKERGIDDSAITEVNGAEVELPALREAFQAAALFSEQRLVVVRDWLLSRSAGDADELAEATTAIPETTIVVLAEYGEPDRRRSGFKRVLKQADKAWEFSRVDAGAAAQWVVREAKSRGVALAPGAAASLVGKAGTDLWNLSTELEKLASAADGPIDEALIDKLVTDEHPADIFALVDAVGRRDATVALTHLGRLVEQGEPPLRIFAMLVRQIRLLLSAQSLLAQGRREAELTKIMSVPPFVARKLAGQAKRFTERELRGLYHELAELDHAFKTGTRDPQASLELFIAETCQAGP